MRKWISLFMVLVLVLSSVNESVLAARQGSLYQVKEKPEDKLEIPLNVQLNDNLGQQISNIPTTLRELIADDSVNFSSTQIISEEQKKSLTSSDIDTPEIFVKEQIKKIDSLPAELKKIAAFYYNDIFKGLPEADRLEVVKWDVESINNKISKLTAEQIKQLELAVPAVVAQFDYHTARDEYDDKYEHTYSVKEEMQVSPPSGNTETEESALAAATAGNYVVTPFKNEYNYRINTDDLVDPVYQTANRRVTDLSLNGKAGLDLYFTRTYNSLQSKVLEPRYYTAYNDSNGTYTQIQGNAATAIDLKENPSFIATGWSLNLPFMVKEYISAEVRPWTNSLGCQGGYQNTNVCYQSGYNLKGIDGYEKVVFTIDDGRSFEFRNGIIFDYPYHNVRYQKSGTEHNLILDEMITYTFNDSGELIRKSNQFGDAVTYSYNQAGVHGNQNITVTDSYGRKATILKTNDHVIKGIKAEIGSTVIQEISYDVTRETNPGITFRKWTPNGYMNVTEALTYWQLRKVVDNTDPANIKTLESYEYFPIDSTKLADFNLKVDTSPYYSTPTGEPATPNCCNYSSVIVWGDEARTPLEENTIAEAVRNNYGEVPYLLLRNVNYFNGLQVQFNYKPYNPAWGQEPNIVMQELVRNSMRLYQDKHILQFVAYHPVERVDYIYSENGTQKVMSENYINYHPDHGYQWNEYWKTSKANVPRLKSSSRYGDSHWVGVKKISPVKDSPLTTFQQYINNGSDYVLTYDITNRNWARGATTMTMSPTEEYSFRFNEVRAFIYDAGHKQPKAMHRFGQNFGRLEEVHVPPDGGSVAKTTASYEYDNWGYLTRHIDESGNETTIDYGGPLHQVSQKQTRNKENSSTVKEVFTYYSSNDADVNKRNQLAQHDTVQEYRNPSSPSEVLSDILTTKFMAYDSTRQVSVIEETASGVQYGQEPQTTRKEYSYTNQGYLDLEKNFVSFKPGSAPSLLEIDYETDWRGRITKVTYPDKTSSVTNYDHLDRVISQVIQPVGASSRTTMVQYDDLNRKVAVSMPDGEIVETFYTPFGLETKQQRIVSGMTRVMVENESHDGITISKTKPYGEESLKTVYEYDHFGNVIQQIDSVNRVTSIYHTNIALINGKEDLRHSQFALEPDGKMTFSFKAPNGMPLRTLQLRSEGDRSSLINDTFYQYDSFGRKVEEKVTFDTQIQTTRYGYDGAGNLIYLKDNENQVYRYVYNQQGQLLATYVNGKLHRQKSYNEAGWLLRNKEAGGKETTYTYRNNGLVDRYTDRNGQSIVYQYSPYNEQTDMTIYAPGGGEVYKESRTYYPTTRLLQQVSNSEKETIAYHYDSWKRNDKKIVAGRTYTFGHDQYDRMTSIVYPDQKTVAFTYDTLNRIETVEYPDMGKVSYTYITAENDNRIITTYPNNKTQEVNWDAAGNITSIIHDKVVKDPATGYFTATYYEFYNWDAFGNIRSKRQPGSNPQAPEKVSSFGYDGINRIIQENAPNWQQKYTYDNQNNRKAMESGVHSFERTQNQALKYNPLNQLKTYTSDEGTASYTYYGDGLRATSTVNGELTRYVYVNGKVVEELNADGSVKARNIWGNSLLFRDDRPSGEKGYYYHNGHGDVVNIKDAQGNILNWYEYDIWGNIVSEIETINNPYKYSGEIRDEVTGYYYLRARYYDPTVGRFINEDTYEGQIDNPLSLNLYTYAHNNPLRWIDPTGHWIEGIDNQLSKEDQKAIRQLTSDWYKAKTKALKDNLHSAATRIRQAHFIAKANQIREEVNDEFWEVIDEAIPSAKSVGKKITKTVAKKVLGLVTDDDPTFVFRRTDTFDGRSLTAEPKGIMKKNGPKLKDDKALSMSTKLMVPGWMTTLEGINDTGLFFAEIDNSRTGHVSVTPTAAAQQAFGTMEEWLNSYHTANESPHFYTSILRAISRPIK